MALMSQCRRRYMCYMVHPVAVSVAFEERNLMQLQSQSWSWTFFLIQHLLSFIDVYHWCLQRNPATAHLYHRIRSLVLECFCFGSFNYQVGHGTSKDFYIGTGTKVKSPSQKMWFLSLFDILFPIFGVAFLLCGSVRVETAWTEWVASGLAAPLGGASLAWQMSGRGLHSRESKAL